MHTNYKNIRTTLSVISFLLIGAILLVQYNAYSYIDNKMYDSEEQLKIYQEEVNLYEKNINLYKKELSDIRSELANVENELENAKKELANVKNELSNVKKDVANLQTNLKKNTTSQNNSSPNTNSDEWYVGRLYVPAANISVALYHGVSQKITDRVDSANYFSFFLYSKCKIIADHNYQEFSKLFNVKVGMVGYIKFNDGHTEYIKCVEVLNGYNKRKYLTDINDNVVSEREDYLMYTCKDRWENILVCLWDIT